jgi:hypothetical protein
VKLGFIDRKELEKAEIENKSSLIVSKLLPYSFKTEEISLIGLDWIK